MIISFVWRLLWRHFLACAPASSIFGFKHRLDVPPPPICPSPQGRRFPPSPEGHEAADTGLAYAPVSQAHGHHHSAQCFASLHRSAARFCTTPGGL